MTIRTKDIKISSAVQQISTGSIPAISFTSYKRHQPPFQHPGHLFLLFTTMTSQISSKYSVKNTETCRHWTQKKEEKWIMNCEQKKKTCTCMHTQLFEHCLMNCVWGQLSTKIDLWLRKTYELQKCVSHSIIFTMLLSKNKF